MDRRNESSFLQELERIRHDLTGLSESAEAFLDCLPAIRRHDDCRYRTKRFLNDPKRAAKARWVLDAENRRIDQYYEEFREGFFPKAHRVVKRALEQLHGVIPRAEELEDLKRLTQESDPSRYGYRIDISCRAVKLASEMVERTIETSKGKEAAQAPQPPLMAEKSDAVPAGPGRSDALPGGLSQKSIQEPSGKPENSSDTVRTGQKRKHGKAADMERHHKIAVIVKSIGGGTWQKQETLRKVGEAIDNAKLAPPKTWADRHPPVRSWSRAVEHYPRDVIRMIRHHLKKASESHSAATTPD
jgi:hypothetical protein